MSISKEHLQYLINVGKAIHKLEEVAKHKLLDDLSKYNDYWISTDEDACEKLDATRRQLMCISEQIWHVVSLLQVESQEDYGKD